MVLNVLLKQTCSYCKCYSNRVV